MANKRTLLRYSLRFILPSVPRPRSSTKKFFIPGYTSPSSIFPTSTLFYYDATYHPNDANSFTNIYYTIYLVTIYRIKFKINIPRLRQHSDLRLRPENKKKTTSKHHRRIIRVVYTCKTQHFLYLYRFIETRNFTSSFSIISDTSLYILDILTRR